VLRGNHRQRIFDTRGDRARLDEIVSEVLTRFGARLHAYCWMTNHLHLLPQVAEAPLGRLMHRIASRYARYYQSRLRRPDTSSSAATEHGSSMSTDTCSSWSDTFT
jgi:REP element-mobilizing transposase RayT